MAITPGGKGAPEHGFRAIFDTGTQMTAISARVVERTRPDHVGETLMTLADGSEKWTDVFWVGVRVLLGLGATEEAPVHDVQASLMPGPLGGCDVLLGMDIISQWHVTLSDGECVIKL